VKALAKSPLYDIPHQILKAASKVGVEADESKRSATYFQIDHSKVLAAVNEYYKGKVEVLSIVDAVKKYDWLKDYLWRLIPPDKDEYTHRVHSELGGGYFIRILPGVKVDLPLQACLVIAKEGFEQAVHNVIIAEEGSDAHIITGCTLHPHVNSSLHIGVSEFFVKRGAKLNFTMVHSWSQGTVVKPRSAALIEEGATFISNYICLNPVKEVQAYPVAYVAGRRGIAVFNSILYAARSSFMDIGSRVELVAPEARSEVTSRAVASSGSKVVARGMLIASASPVKAHLECKGLILDDDSSIHAIPELVGSKRDVDLSHEAAVGKLADHEIAYLMSRGLSREDAVSVLVRGFLNVELLGLPKELADEINALIMRLAKGM